MTIRPYSETFSVQTMFIHLHCHSHYSFLRAVPRPEEIVQAAAEQAQKAGPAVPRTLRHGAVALTDTNGLYAAVPFCQAAREAGVRPIVGAVVDMECGGLPPLCRGEACLAQGGPRPAPTRSILLLAANLTGYSNLCRLVTKRQIDEKPVTLEALKEHREGLIVLCPVKNETRNSTTGNRKTGGASPAPTTVNSQVACLKDIFGDALYLQVQNLGPGGGRALREAVRIGRELGVPLVATNNVHFIRPEEHLHHRVLNAIRAGSLLTKVAPPDITTAEAYFKSAEEMRRAFPDHPEALAATLEIAERCNLELPLGKTIFPEFPVPAGETPFSYLWKLCFEGARQRYRPPTPEVLARLAHELGVIEKLHLAPFFLLVWDIAEEARRRGIPAVARGSAASSIVTYCLGISRVCPLRWGLYFERFLNEQRGDIPDIDLDICGARRDELLDYVYQRWGQEHVAMIGSFVTMHARLAVREVAKVFGLSPGEVNHFTRRLPHRPVREIVEAIRTLPECRQLPVHDEPWKTILGVALRLDDFPRHLGIHPCGTVIAAQPLTNLAPLEWATKGIVVTQYDMNAIEALGLIKMDLLGQRGLTTMSLALRNIETQNSEGAASSAPAAGNEQPAQQIDFDAIPEGDPATCEMIARGRTMGVFQIESPGMRGLLRALGARRHAVQEGGRGFNPAETTRPSSPLPATAADAAVAGSNGKDERPSGTAEAVPSQSEEFTLEEICLALALIRPGAAEYGSKETFLKRLRGQEPVRYPHPSVAPILRETLGICVYQEQVMQLAQTAGALSLAEADLVRRSTAKFADRRERERLHAKFLKSAARMGLEGAARDETWQMVEKFAGFGFCKAHAATYADLSYRIAYLKAHHPAEFLAAMCSSGAGFYHVSAYVEEAKRWGIEVRLPSVNASRMEYTTEPAPALGGRGFNPAETARFSSPLPATAADAAVAGSNKKDERPCGTAKAVPSLDPATEGEASLAPTTENGHRAMRIGLMQVKGLRTETIRAIVRSREECGPYRSLEDFLARVPAERDEMESLIKCGAFDEVRGEDGHAAVARLFRGGDFPTGGHGFSRAEADFRRAGALAPEEPRQTERAQHAAPLHSGRQDTRATRPALLWRLNLIGARPVEAPAGALLFPVATPRHAATEIPLLGDYTRAQRLAYEQEILEVTVSGHPLDLVTRNGEIWSTDVARAVEFCGARLQPRQRPAFSPSSGASAPQAVRVGQRVTLLGWAITFRHVGTKNHRNMMFVTLEDQRGVFEAVLFPEAYERYGGLVFETRTLRVTGRVEPDGQINCEKLERAVASG